MKKKLRCAVIGAGSIGVDHLKSLVSHAGVHLVAFAEPNRFRATQLQRRFSLERCYGDYRELLRDPDIEAVTIALPNHLHAPAAKAALRSGKHVLLEKPMARNLAEARQIRAAAHRAEKHCMTCMSFRFNRHTQIARAEISRGALGHIYHIRCFWLRSQGIPRIGSWFTQRNLSGGGCMCDLGVHMIDLALHLLDDFEVSSVSAMTHGRLGKRGLGEMDWGKSPIATHRPFDVEDYGTALLRLKSGRSVTLEIAWAGFRQSDQREYGLEILGDKAGMSLFPAQLYRQGREGYETILLERKRVPYPENRVHHFVDCVMKGRAPMVTMDQSLKVQAVLDAIYASARSGREVPI